MIGWGAIKKALNSTIGTKNFKPLDKIVKDAILEGATLQDLTITKNGEYTAEVGYDALRKVNVNVPIPDGYIEPTGKLSIEQNGEYDVSSYQTAEVNVPDTIPEGYIKPEGTLNVSANGSYKVTSYDNVVVNVPTDEYDYVIAVGDEIQLPDEPLRNQEAVLSNEGIVRVDNEVEYWNVTGLAEGSCTIEITVEGHDEPDASYTVLVVAAASKPEGSITITENGRHNVSEYAEAVVNVPIPSGYIKPTGTLEINVNGTHDIKGYESVKVNVLADDNFDYVVEVGDEFEIPYETDINEEISLSTVGVITVHNEVEYLAVIANAVGTCTITVFTEGYDEPNATYKVKVVESGTGAEYYDGTITIA